MFLFDRTTSIEVTLPDIPAGPIERGSMVLNRERSVWAVADTAHKHKIRIENRFRNFIKKYFGCLSMIQDRLIPRFCRVEFY
jgi:hypothetical protein